MFFLDNKTQLLSTMILAGGRGIAQLGQIAKSRPKLDFLKIVKLTGHTYGCNSLTNFENQDSPETEMIDVALKKIVKSQQAN